MVMVFIVVFVILVLKCVVLFVVVVELFVNVMFFVFFVVVGVAGGVLSVFTFARYVNVFVFLFILYVVYFVFVFVGICVDVDCCCEYVFVSNVSIGGFVIVVLFVDVVGWRSLRASVVLIVTFVNFIVIFLGLVFVVVFCSL